MVQLKIETVHRLQSGSGDVGFPRLDSNVRVIAYSIEQTFTVILQ
jgi:hypothetical protein